MLSMIKKALKPKVDLPNVGQLGEIRITVSQKDKLDKTVTAHLKSESRSFTAVLRPEGKALAVVSCTGKITARELENIRVWLLSTEDKGTFLQKAQALWAK